MYVQRTVANVMWIFWRDVAKCFPISFGCFFGGHDISEGDAVIMPVILEAPTVTLEVL